MFSHARLSQLVFAMLVVCTAIAVSHGFAQAQDFALKDGDTVVFLGDSITAAQTYGKIIENYTLLRFPERKVRFINAGRGGDTAAGGLARLDKDVLDRGATVLTVAYGVNDIGWGLKADDEHKQKYLDSVREIVRRCREKNVRVFICSAAITATDPDKAEHDFLQTMCDEGLAVAKELGGGTIDLQRQMRVIQRRVIAAGEGIADKEKRPSLHVADGVHLSELGQLAMAFAILQGLGAPADVSAAAIDADGGTPIEQRGCRIDNVKAAGDTIEFDRQDEGLPLNQGLFWALNYRFVPIHDELNGYLLTVKGLPPGKYNVLADGRKLGMWSAAQLGGGINIASATADPWQPGGPWDVQATIVKSLTEARANLRTSQVEAAAYVGDAPLRGGLAENAAEINQLLEEMQRKAARPRKYHFVVERQ
jgi:lysophospholipase L1-like esterase